MQNFRRNKPLFAIALISSFLVILVACSKKEGIFSEEPSPDLPVVKTNLSYPVQSGTAISGGIIVSAGKDVILKRGVCWSRFQNPEVDLSTKTEETASSDTFSSNISGLSQNTTYYVRSYATNRFGTSYGNQVKIKTPCFSCIADVDGNSYETVTITGSGYSKVWMKKNLNVSRYRNGDPIQTYLSESEWKNTTEGAFAIINNDSLNSATYGKQYNWYAVKDPRGLCPVGWHVPSDQEWYSLEYAHGGPSVAGGNMKSTGTIEAGNGLWRAPNQDASNSKGFSALPASCVGDFFISPGSFSLGYFTAFWSASVANGDSSWTRQLSTYIKSSNRRYCPWDYGMSVRCIRD